MNRALGGPDLGAPENAVGPLKKIHKGAHWTPGILEIYMHW